MKACKKTATLLLALILLLSACSTEPTATTGVETAPRTEVSAASETVPAGESGTVIVSEGSSEATEPAPEPLELGGYAVSSSTREATAAGIEILAQGGNAVDAAVAVAFALGVTEPYSSGLGGSGVMVVYDPATDQGYSLDYYACAGSAPENTDDVAVPGFVAGMQKALDRFGTMSLAEVIDPAIHLAEEGFPATALFARRLTYSAKLRENPAFQGVREGDTVIQQELADTMRLIQTKGADVFYRGKIAQDITEACALTAEDLRGYRAYSRSALRSRFHNIRIYTTTAPTSGVVTSQMLTVADLLDVPDPREDPQGYLEVMKLANDIGFETRRTKLVDPHLYDFDGVGLVSRKYVRKLVNKALKEQESLSFEPDPEKRCTTQFAVIDRNGMLVSVTNTLSDNWGSYICVDGFYLNNTLSNFNASGKNAYEPGKRPRTHFSPVIAVGDRQEGNFCLAIGSPGGDAIPKVVSQVLIDVLKFGVDLQTAVDAGRYYYDDDGLLCLEVDNGAEARIDLARISQRYYFSSSHVMFGCTAIVGYDPAQGVVAVSDLRRDGSEALVVSEP